MSPVLPPTAAHCHLCGSADLEVAAKYALFHRVTSDCKPWPPGGQLGRCQSCGMVQTLVTRDWQDESKKIYAHYEIYHQGGGIEQQVFDVRCGAGCPRSERIIRSLRGELDLPAKGRLLDFGCGNGSFLSAWSRQLPGWSLVGSEVSEKYKSESEAIVGVERLYTGEVAAIPGEFDVISLIHVFEHIPSPFALLEQLQRKLAPNGLLLIEVPDCGENPFMLPVVDHCSHFSPPLLAGVVAAAGFEPLRATHEWVAKEVSVVARSLPRQHAQKAPRLPQSDSERVFQGWRLLESANQKAQALAHRSSFGLFGTAIAATWLDAQTHQAARFFVDEDPNRIGRSHLNRPILAPSELPRGATIFVALPRFLAEKVAARLKAASQDVDVVMP